ncbi:unnamed protein product [Tetraodon nigroviridis]|uniref:Chromosome 19 SCAF14691, whole genome shotgun sequence n=1 Tax=Tetraodon nigroviridis TaxID=99883 RepID=Q4SAD0_TETNG|nr:unnamed protein product [Tetraodon nigroviridis]
MPTQALTDLLDRIKEDQNAHEIISLLHLMLHMDAERLDGGEQAPPSVCVQTEELLEQKATEGQPPAGAVLRGDGRPDLPAVPQDPGPRPPGLGQGQASQTAPFGHQTVVPSQIPGRQSTAGECGGAAAAVSCQQRGFPQRQGFFPVGAREGGLALQRRRRRPRVSAAPSGVAVEINNKRQDFDKNLRSCFFFDLLSSL